MCRKLCRVILAAVLALSVFSTGALAAMPQYPGRLGHCHVVYGTSACGDANGDGVCDVHGAQCRRYCHSVRRHHLCRKPLGTLCHFTANGSWAPCSDADCNGFCDTCGAVFPVTAGSAANGGNTGTAGTSGNNYGTSGSTWTGGNNYGSSGTSGNSYGNYGYGCYGGGHHSGHHGGHC